jgi:predicted Zn-dependent peptidase
MTHSRKDRCVPRGNHRGWGFAAAAAFAACVALAAGGCGAGHETAETARFDVPIEYHTLDNGLKVVLSPDHTTPTVVVAVYYNIGFRIEPRDRTGFAHLFEHMMFQGSENLGKMAHIRLVQLNGGVLNGSTRFDFTNYFEIVPANVLEKTLWAEADRMRGLAVTQENLTNQKGVVTNEVKNAVLNQPYGGFPWLDLPQIANSNWYNAHNFYGDLADLEAATLEDVQAFFDTYYAPNNAVVVLVGDFNPDEALQMVERQFGDIEPAELPDAPDLTEPPQTEEKLQSKVDERANRPALGFAYHMPERNTPEFFAMGLLDQILVQGEDSLLHKALVKDAGFTSEVSGGINYLLGNQFDYDGPMLWMAQLYHDSANTSEEIMAAVDATITNLQAEMIDQAALDRAKTKMRSNLYDIYGQLYGFGRANLLASFALFDDSPALINEIEKSFEAVTPELIQQTAAAYLRPENRTVLAIEPGASS